MEAGGGRHAQVGARDRAARHGGAVVSVAIDAAVFLAWLGGAGLYALGAHAAGAAIGGVGVVAALVTRWRQEKK
jgi:hypothetical protein